MPLRADPSAPEPRRAPAELRAGRLSATHAHALYVHADSRLHRIPPECKVAATVLFVLAVVLTPREALWAYALYASLIALAATLARIPAGFLLRRLLIEIPFVLFAVALPFFGPGPRLEVGPLHLSVEGLWGAWNVLVKATIAVGATIVLGGTTPIGDILRGLEVLRMPKAVTGVAGFMIRYADVITDEMARMRVARASRGYDPRWLWQARAIASSAGTLFIRSYERGERVYLAMVSRGFDGSLPELPRDTATTREWLGALAFPAAAALVAAGAWLRL